MPSVVATTHDWAAKTAPGALLTVIVLTVIA